MFVENNSHQDILARFRRNELLHWTRENSFLLGVLFIIQFLVSYILFFLFSGLEIDFLIAEYLQNSILLIVALGIFSFVFFKQKLLQHGKKILFWAAIFQAFFVFLAFGNTIFINDSQGKMVQIMTIVVKSKTVKYSIQQFLQTRIFGAAELHSKAKMQSDPQEKIATFKKAIRLNSEYYNPYAILALTYFEQGDCINALKVMSLVVTKIEDPENQYIDSLGKGYLFGTYAYILQHCHADRELIERYYDLAQYHAPDFLETYINRAEHYLNTNQLEKAKADLDHCLDASIEAHLYSSCLTNASVLSEKQGDIPGALQQARLATEKNQKNADAWNNLGYYLLLQENYEEAEKSLVTALELNPNLAVARANLARVTLQTSRRKE